MSMNERRPTPNDSYPTPTSELQAATERVFASYVPTDKNMVLQKNQHVQFLARFLIQGFPSMYKSQDASQPWLMFWMLQGLSTLQVSLDSGNNQRYALCVFDRTKLI
jgi:protein farnesyltransferase subunit beta